MSFNPLATAKKISRERNLAKTTVIKLEKYELDKDNPKNNKIIGTDLFETDANGVPKRVEVKHANENTNGVKEFANPTALMHVTEGGMIRLSQYRVDGSGAYVASHMHRITRDGGPKVGGNQDKYDVSIMKGWTKLYPKKEASGELTIFERGGRLFHRADVMVVPDDADVTQVNFGADTFESEVDAALSKAVDMTPKGAQPMLVVRMAGQLQADEIRLPNFRMDGDIPVPLTKEEIIETAKERSKLANSYFPSHQQAKDAGQTGQCEFVTGFALNAIGLKWDGKSMQKVDGEDVPNYNDRSLIEDWVSETAQRHALPREEGDTKTKYKLDNGGPQYAFGVLSYRVKQADSNTFVQADLDSFGRDHGAKMRVSPNAGLDQKPNPWQASEPANKPAATNTQSNAGNQTEAAPEKPAAQSASQAPEPKTATANTAQESQPSQSTAAQSSAPQPDEVVEEQTDFGLDDFADNGFDVDMEDIENQLSQNSL